MNWTSTRINLRYHWKTIMLWIMALITALVLVAALGIAGTSHAAVYEVPLFLRADDPTQESILRLQSAYPKWLGFQRIQIIGYDDTGTVHGPVWLTVQNFGDITLTSSDLEQGNAEKGLPRGLGTGTGDWRLVLTTADDYLDVRSYAHDLTESGPLAPMHQLETAHDILPGAPWLTEGIHQPTHVVSLLMPADPTGKTTLVRIFNRKDHPVRIRLRADTIPWHARCDLPPYATLVKTAEEIRDLMSERSWLSAEEIQENQRDGWRMTVAVLAEPADPSTGLSCQAAGDDADMDLADAEAGTVTNIGVMTLIEDNKGNLTNISGPPAVKIGTRRPPRDSPTGWHGFDITLEFGEEFNEEWRDAITHAVKRVEQIITANYPDSYADLSGCGITGRRRRVDELLIRFEVLADVPSYIGGSAHVCSSVPEPGFPGGRPNAGLIRLNIASAGPDPEQVYDFLALDRVILHETLHILGIGGFWRRSGYLRLDVARPEFTGPRATAAFARLYPRRAAAARKRGVHGVPVEDDGAHWRSSAYAVDGYDATYTVPDDIMTPGGNRAQHNLLTEITLGALEDLGYTVDYRQTRDTILSEY